MTSKDPKVDEFLKRAGKWRQEMAALRRLALGCQLTETVKWRLPCYTLDNGNVAIIQTFKDYCALMFFKGALLKDPKGMLKAPGASQAGRQLRFTSVREISARAPVVKAYIREAIEIEKAGLKVKLKETRDYAVPEELQRRLEASRALRTAFDALTPGRQRAYIYHCAQPKLAKTRASRVDKCIPRILRGEGLNDPPGRRRK